MIVRRLIVILISIAAIAGFVDRASAATVTLPLDGYFRVGRYMPVRIAGASSGQRIDGTGIVPVRIETLGSSDAVVPLLMTSATPTLSTMSTTVALKPLEAQQRLVGLVGSASEADARRMFPQNEVVPIRLSWPLAGAAVEWEALDGIVIADAPPPDEATVMVLLGAGITFSVRSPDIPDTRWPWRRDGESWTLRYDPLGPRDCFFEPMAMLASYVPGISLASRCNTVIIATIFVILTIGATLLRGKLRLISIICVVAGSLIAIGVWARVQPAVRSAGGEILVVSDDLIQEELWSFQAALRPTVARASPGLAHPMLADWNEAAACQLTLVWQGTGQPSDMRLPFFDYHASAGMKMAFHFRYVMPRGNVTIPMNPLHRSPLRLVVDETYLKNGAPIIGEGPEISSPLSAAPDRWPTVYIAASKEKG